MTAGPPLRAAGGEVAATLAIAARARALRAEGRDVISLAIGEPDFPTPAHIVEAAHAAVLRGETKYTPVEGTVALREAIARKLARENGFSPEPGGIIVTNGSKQAIHDAFAATLEEGGEVVVPAPYWASYPLIARMLGGVAVPVACRAAEGWALDPALLAAAITPRTRWVVLNFPNNPTGAVCDAAALARIGDVLLAHPDIWVLSDDIYEHLIHDGRTHATLAAVCPDLRDRVLTVGGVSKSWSMTGWRIGWAAGPRRLIAAMAAIQGNVTSGASSVGQAAAVAALDGPTAPREAMRVRYAARAAAAHAALAPVLPVVRPSGAFYLFPDVSALGDDAAVAGALLERAGVATVPGSAFGAPGFLRLSVACADDVLAEACGRIERFVHSHR